MRGQICDVSRYLASVDAIQVIERGLLSRRKFLANIISCMCCIVYDTKNLHVYTEIIEN